MNSTLFHLNNKVAVVTGGNGVLGGAMADGLADHGAKTVILGRNETTIQQKVTEITKKGYEAIGIKADVVDKNSLVQAKKEILDAFGNIDILVNAAGGNVGNAVINPEDSFVDMDMEAHQQVQRLNLTGTLLPCQVFGEEMIKQKSGSIINISSATVANTVTRLLSYSAAKAAVENYTKWLAVELATKYGDGLRVNAIMPGFFVGEQNRELLLNNDGSLTERGDKIIRNTPMARFGEPGELVGAVVYLASDASGFVTGTVLTVDGGFNCFSGV